MVDGEGGLAEGEAKHRSEPVAAVRNGVAGQAEAG